MQVSQRDRTRGFLFLEIRPDETLSLVSGTESEFEHAVAATESDAAWTVSNGLFTLELSRGDGPATDTAEIPGPIRRVREAGGPWRGRTFFDTARAPLREEASWRERGPVRSIYHYRIEFSGGGFYELELTVDAGLDFARLHEKFEGGAADQIVWDFAGADVPERLSLLDSTAGYTPRWLHYHLDQRHARLWCWTQFSQLHDLSDGLALHFSGSDDVVGLVTLEGGKWQGNALNHLEAWTRRWQTADPATRRLPADAKADSFPGIAAIPARGRSVNEPHFTLEGWLRHGERHFALVLSTAARIAPQIERQGANGETGCSVALGHFEDVSRRDLYSRLQGRLRQIHIQHGMLPLQDQLGLIFEWPVEENFTRAATEAQKLALEVSAVQHANLTAQHPDIVRHIDDFLAARVYGFWEGSGAAYTNCVVSRRVGPDMLLFESLVREGRLTAAQVLRWRAWFVLLAHLYHTDNFYPGASTMEPIGSDNAVEPTIAGMANQNFYTDIITLFAYAAQAFPAHPSVEAWREKFLANWHRQLEYHMYPQSGVWEESHTYYQHVLGTVVPLFLRRKADGTRDDFADAAFQKLVAGAVPQMTPPNAVAGGLRHMVPFGDHGVDAVRYRYLYRELARAFAPHAPELAGQLAWVYRGMKGDDLADVPVCDPELSTGYVAGLGFFFRGKDEGGETLLALRSGMAWGHHHTDDGSIQFYARGRALIVDAASSQPQQGDRKVSAAGHSRAVVEGLEPLTHFWRFNRGWILDSRTGPGLAYAVAGTPLFAAMPRNLRAAPYVNAVWELRAVVQLAPAVYLVADYLDASQRHFVRFHVAHREAKTEEDRVVASFGAEGRLEIVPLFAVDPPALAHHQPLNAAKIPQEVTTAVEYAGVTGPLVAFCGGGFWPSGCPRTGERGKRGADWRGWADIHSRGTREGAGGHCWKQLGSYRRGLSGDADAGGLQ